MQKLIYGGLFLVALGILIFGCEKEYFDDNKATDNNKTNNSKQKPIKNKSVSIFANENNPADSIGVYHNLMLDDLLNEYSYSNNHSIMEEQVKANTPLVLDTYFPDISDIDLNELNNIPSMEGAFYLIDFDDYSEIIGSLNGLSTSEAQLIIAYVSECISHESHFADNNICEILIEIENDFIQNRGANFDEFYYTSSIFRYSLIYHYSLNNKQKLSKWWKKAIGDAAGALIGGALSGGMGALQGAAAGSAIADLL
ncbi:glycine zipper family protein [Brumimicrobium oceani]|uniref:Uncharacterized protein n=1 Tax=Brumimicrobium oceani TaxID=2100725 RepID=A0A2U2X0C4_9FLAO|nr:glycine zipper family protein [Brumimicrobium oceani]PWH81227.1 hypothetical protein DIT68_15950 [Brumimicrobium oceani]